MKLKYLLPVATIASVATVVTPLVTSCGNAVVKLDKFTHLEKLDVDVLTNGKTINVKKDKKYTVKIDMQNWSGDESSLAGEWEFFLCNSKISHLFPLADFKVKINQKELTYIKIPNDVDSPDEYTYYVNDKGNCLLVGYENALNKNSTMQIDFKAKNDINDAKFILYVGRH